MMEEKIIIGKIVAPHGVRGDIRVLPQTETPELYLDLEYFYLEDGRKMYILRSRFQKNMVLLTLKDVNTMEKAEALRNCNVLVTRDMLPPLPQGRYYVKDLKGFVCVDESGRQIGTFEDTLPTGSTDVFVIKGVEGKDILVPAIGDNILEIVTEKRRMLIRLPEWLE